MTFNNRKLSPKEMQLYKQGRCICCGQERKESLFYTSHSKDEPECISCFLARTRVHEPSLWQMKEHFEQIEQDSVY